MNLNADNQMWRGAKARKRFKGQRRQQVGPGKFPASWFESMRTRQVLTDRSEVIGEADWIPEIEQHCVKKLDWLHTSPEDCAVLLEAAQKGVDWNNQYGPPGMYIDIQYIHDVAPEYHEVIERQHQKIVDRVGDIARGDPPNISRIKANGCMQPHRDTPLRWCVLYLPLPFPGQVYAPTEHLWGDSIYGIHDFEPGQWLIFNQDIWHAANNFTNQDRFTLQLVLDTSYENFVDQHT